MRDVSRVSSLCRAIVGLLLVSLLWMPLALQASERVALVIGNAAYDHAPLRNPVNDATDLANALRTQGFTRVIEVNDADLMAMRRALRDFREALVGAELGLFYFAGHGAQYQNENYLIPLRSRIDAAVDLDIEALGAQQVLRQMESAGSQINVVILDACRDNPYPAAARSGNRGLARLESVTRGSLIAFATAPGQVADDGAGRNSPYTAALLRYLGEPLPLPELFNRVGFAVTESTRGRQVPWYQASPLPPIQIAAVSGEQLPQIVTPSTPVSPEALELVFWQSIQASREVGEFQAYLDRYPDGSFAGLARARITALQAQETETPPNPTDPSASVRLSVKATPADAQIRIMNMASEYVDGMALDPGRYDIKVSASGYQTHRRWVDLAAGDRVVEVELEQVPDTASVESTPEPVSGVSAPSASSAEIRPATGTVHRDQLRDGTPGPEMVFIRGGSFMMGSPASEQGRRANRERQQRVQVNDVWIGKYAVTFDEYDRFARASGRDLPSDRGWGRGRRPVIHVSWNDATAYAEWLSQQTGQQYRLPTEAEWEYAARAGTTTARFWGDNADDACEFANVHDEKSKLVNEFRWRHHRCDDGYAQTAPVGSYAPNPWGLYDMLGNVWEWTCSTFTAQYGGAEQRCDVRGSHRTVRGGSWNYTLGGVRSAYRYRFTLRYQSDVLGVRLVRSP